MRRMYEMFTQDVPQRLSDPAIRKLFFITSDGGSNACPRDITLFMSIPTTNYAIGSTKKSDFPTLFVLARNIKENTKMYDNFPQFVAELPALLYETCQVGSHVVPTAKPANSSTSSTSDKDLSFNIAGMMPGDTRYFSFNITEGSTNNLKVTPKSVDLKIYASFTNLYPSEVSYDFKTECKAGVQCSLVVKHPAQISNAVCVQSAQGTKQYSVAVMATGGTGPDDLTANNIVGTNNGGDYSASDHNGTFNPSKKQVFVQARMGLSIGNVVSRFLLVASLFIV